MKTVTHNDQGAGRYPHIAPGFYWFLAEPSVCEILADGSCYAVGCEYAQAGDLHLGPRIEVPA